jgi:hypothetical protein
MPSNCTASVRDFRKTDSCAGYVRDNVSNKHLFFPFRISGILHVSLLLKDFMNIEKQL